MEQRCEQWPGQNRVEKAPLMEKTNTAPGTSASTSPPQPHVVSIVSTPVTRGVARKGNILQIAQIKSKLREELRIADGHHEADAKDPAGPFTLKEQPKSKPFAALEPDAARVRHTLHLNNDSS